MALTRDGDPGTGAGSDDTSTDDGLSEDEERDALEGIGGSGSRAGGGSEERLREDDGTFDDDDPQTGDDSGTRDNPFETDDPSAQPGAETGFGDVTVGDTIDTTEGSGTVEDSFTDNRGERFVTIDTDGDGVADQIVGRDDLQTDTGGTSDGGGLTDGEQRNVEEGIGGSGSRAGDDGTTSGDTGGGGSQTGDDDRVLSPTSPDDPVPTEGGGTTDNRGGDTDPTTPEDSGADMDDMPESGDQLTGDDDRVLSPTSPEEPVPTEGGGTADNRGGDTDPTTPEDSGRDQDDIAEPDDSTTQPDDVPDAAAPGVDDDTDAGLPADPTTNPDSSAGATTSPPDFEDGGTSQPDRRAGQGTVAAREDVALAGAPFSIGIGEEDAAAASEAAREAADVAVDVAFQESEEVAPLIGLRGERARTDRFDIRGPSLTLEEGPEGEIDTDITDALTEGRGLFSEADERGLREDIRRRRAFFGVGAEAEALAEDATGSETAGDFARGLGRVPGEVAAAPAAGTLLVDTASEAVVNAPEVVAEEGAGDVALTTANVAGAAVGAQAQQAAANPAETAGVLVGSAGTSAAGGRLLGSAARRGTDFRRTVGGTEVDLEDVTQESVARNVRTGGAEGDRFPGAEDPDTFRSDPAAAVREQARRQTPPDVEERFSGGDDEAVVLKKALDVEPEGPGRGRSAQGFESAPGETLDDFDFETPGSFVGPDLSPNFLRVGDRSTRFSLRPGLPDTGNEPTGVLIRTRVENPDADTLDEFNREMIDRSGETTARTKPAGEVNVGEIEAVIPPGSQFRDIGGSRTRALARRLGVGSDFFTRVDGRRVPLRPVTPDADAPDAGDVARADARDVDVPDGADGQGPAFTGRTLDELIDPPEAGTDRPLPVAPAGGSGGATPTSPTRPDAPSRDFGGGGTSADSTSPALERDVGGGFGPTGPSVPTTSRADGGSDAATPGGSAPTSPVPESDFGSGTTGRGDGGGGTPTSPTGTSESEPLSPSSPPSSPPGSNGGSPAGGSSLPPSGGSPGGGSAGGPGSPGGSPPGGGGSSPPSDSPPGTSSPPGGGSPGSPTTPPGGSPPAFSPPSQPPNDPPDIDFDFGDDDDDRRRRQSLSDFEKRFTTEVATPDAVLDASEEASFLEEDL